MNWQACGKPKAMKWDRMFARIQRDMTNKLTIHRPFKSRE